MFQQTDLCCEFLSWQNKWTFNPSWCLVPSRGPYPYCVSCPESSDLLFDFPSRLIQRQYRSITVLYMHHMRHLISTQTHLDPLWYSNVTILSTQSRLTLKINHYFRFKVWIKSHHYLRFISLNNPEISCTWEQTVRLKPWGKTIIPHQVSPCSSIFSIYMLYNKYMRIVS
jgi:hypothetical protein